MKKVVIITGASSGIGYATAVQLLEEGYTVYCAARSVDKMKALEDKGGILIKMDIAKEEDIVRCIDQIIKEQGQMDVLFNNAGFGLFGSVEETSIKDARYQFEVNLFGLARITQLVIPHMRKRNSGTIINTSSMGGKIYTPLGAWYHATKHALEGWSDCLRFELKQFGIDVVIIEPGAIATDFGAVMLPGTLKRSGSGPYKNIADRFGKMARGIYENPDAASPPSVIADVVSRAIKAKEPKTRYVAGKMAKFYMFLRRIVSDRQFDKMLVD